MKKRVYEILDVAQPGDAASRWFDYFMITLIGLNVLAVVLGTVERFEHLAGFFRIFEIVSVILFTIEYVLRVWSITASEKYRHPVTGRIRFMLTPLAIVDLLAILPFYAPMLIPVDLRVLRILRLFRVLRLLKLSRHSSAVRIFVNVCGAKKAELGVTLFVGLLLLVLTSSLMYYAENQAQPDVFSSIPAALWWGVITLTTVGGGDIWPITGLGKFLASIVALLGVGMIALPAGILSAGFSEEIQKERGAEQKCPHCGKPVNGGGS